MATHSCPSCGKTFSVPDWVDTLIKCPQCRAILAEPRRPRPSPTGAPARPAALAKPAPAPISPPTHSPRRFLVTPAGYDDIGAVLDEMGKGFEHQVVDFDDLTDPSCLEGCDVLFINCSGESGDFAQASQVAPVIRQFVAQGGSLYASDWAGAVIHEAFPGILEFDQMGEEGVLDCRVRDPGLCEMIGRQIRIHFDLGGWWRVRRAAPLARVFVEGQLEAIDGWDDDGEEDRPIGRPWSSQSEGLAPIVVSFPHGEGHVTYTCFHNEAQVSEAEQKLLRFLVLRPVLARTAAAAQATIQAESNIPVREILGTVRVGHSSDIYALRTDVSCALTCLLSWDRPGRLRLLLRDGSGRIARKVEGDGSPLTCNIPGERTGVWTCQVEGLTGFEGGIPFVVTVARPTRSGRQP